MSAVIDEQNKDPSQKLKGQCGAKVFRCQLGDVGVLFSVAQECCQKFQEFALIHKFGVLSKGLLFALHILETLEKHPFCLQMKYRKAKINRI